MSAATLALIATIGSSHGLPDGLLESVVRVESRGHRWAVGFHKHGCDIGLGQIHMRGCPVMSAVWLFGPRVNLRRAAQILRWSERACRRRPGRVGCSQCRWGRYNPGSVGWCGEVRRSMASATRSDCS